MSLVNLSYPLNLCILIHVEEVVLEVRFVPMLDLMSGTILSHCIIPNTSITTRVTK